MSFTKEQVASLTAKLDKGNVKSRSQAGRNVSYIEGWRAIEEANRIFGFDAWRRETVEIKMVVEAPRKIGREPNQKDGWSVAYIGKVRVTVTAGETVIIREGVGYGSGIDADLGSAHESAIKEMETDAMKRALMTFGNPFGLALYDKDQTNVDDGRNHQSNDDRSPADDFYERAKITISNHTDAKELQAWVDANMGHLQALPKEQGQALYAQYTKRLGALAQAPGKAA